MIVTRSFTVVVFAISTLGTLGLVRWRGAIPVAPVQSPSFGRVSHAPADSLDEWLADAEDMTTSNDPFRLANAPSAVRFDPNNENGPVSAQPMTAPLLRPTMTLKAIVGGPPWQAVVDGIPGQPQGTLVRVGLTFDKLVARAVTRDSVIIQGPDTSWVLSFRRPQ